VFGPKERSIKKSTQLNAPLDRVWDALFDPLAMMWMAPRSVFAVAVPGEPQAVGALRCGWRQKVGGLLTPLVFEVVEIEPGRRLVLRERQKPDAFGQIEFHIEPDRDETRATVTVKKHRTHHQWLSTQAEVRRWVEHLSHGWRVASDGEVPTPVDPQLLLTGPAGNAFEQIREINIQAAPDIIWRLVEDEDNTLQPSPGRAHQWRTQHEGTELFFNVMPFDNDGLICTVMQILREGAFTATLRSNAHETVHELIPGAHSSLLRLTDRWDQELGFVGDLTHGPFLEAVKTAAEAQAADEPT
jgi:uncharacterized protein YndB with AHSA1/START domain